MQQIHFGVLVHDAKVPDMTVPHEIPLALSDTLRDT